MLQVSSTSRSRYFKIYWSIVLKMNYTYLLPISIDHIRNLKHAFTFYMHSNVFISEKKD